MTPKELFALLSDHCAHCSECRVCDLCPEGRRLKENYEAVAAERDRGKVLKKYRRAGPST